MPPTNGVPKVTEPHSTTTPVRRPPRMSITYGPSAGVYHTPSRSATRPFDWDAARGLKPAPYDTLATIRKRQSLGGTGKGEEGTPQATGARKRARIIMKSTVSWWEWFMGLPESWWFKLEMLWQEMPLPAAATTGKVVGFSLHILHALVRWSDIRTLRDDDVGWEDMRDESLYGDEEAADGVWIQWTTLATLFLFIFTIMNALVLFTRTKTYDMQLRDGDTPLVNTPNASYVASPFSRLVERNSHIPRGPTMWSYLSWTLAAAWRWAKHAWNFLLWHPIHSDELVSDSVKGWARIQQLEVWDPHDGFMTVFTIYSPLHALLWTALNPTNWITISFIMGIAWSHLHYLTKAYNNTIKDRAIIHAEVLYEYDNRFVFPRLNAVKKDACVMTNEAETVYYRPRTSRGTA